MLSGLWPISRCLPGFFGWQSQRILASLPRMHHCSSLKHRLFHTFETLLAWNVFSELFPYFHCNFSLGLTRITIQRLEGFGISSLLHGPKTHLHPTLLQAGPGQSDRVIRLCCITQYLNTICRACRTDQLRVFQYDVTNYFKEINTIFSGFKVWVPWIWKLGHLQTSNSWSVRWKF